MLRIDAAAEDKSVESAAFELERVNDGLFEIDRILLSITALLVLDDLAAHLFALKLVLKPLINGKLEFFSAFRIRSDCFVSLMIFAGEFFRTFFTDFDDFVDADLIGSLIDESVEDFFRFEFQIDLNLDFLFGKPSLRSNWQEK